MNEELKSKIEDKKKLKKNIGRFSRRFFFGTFLFYLIRDLILYVLIPYKLFGG